MIWGGKHENDSQCLAGRVRLLTLILGRRLSQGSAVLSRFH